jgi:eukaryotic-like serine/threonine-protein kinase
MISDPELYQRAKVVFQRALDLPAAARATHVAAACGDDARLAAEVAALLAAHEEPTDPALLRTTRLRPAVDPSALGSDRGWRVLGEIGRGGMGVVYLGERADGAYQQRVAIKLLQRSGDDSGDALRLQLERQILARLAHPNIARLLDGGAASDGSPYLVIEYIEGERIDRWCDAHRLDVAGRIGLFLKVCDAVTHAHRNLVVHRDIKPDNILVTAAGEPKLLDFGIARVHDTAATLTAAGERPLTPRYASPEQVRGQPVNTLSDVWSLGVLLYELLTGCSPYGHVAGLDYRLPTLICEVDTEPPSRAVRRALAEGGRDDEAMSRPPASAAQLAGDLDAIVLRCLRKAPEQRFQSVEALADDLRAHLAGRPVGARTGERLYRAGRFALRHWAALATAVGVLLLSLAFVVGLALQLDRAQQAEAHTRHALLSATRARDFLVSLLAATSPDETLGRTLSARELLERAGERIADVDDSPDVAASLRLALADAWLALGEPQASAAAAEGALALLPAAEAAPLQRADALATLAQAWLRLARYSEARALFDQVLAIHQREYARHPERLVPTWAMLGRAELMAGEPHAAIEWSERALAALDPAAPAAERLAILATLLHAAAVLGDAERAGGWLAEGDALATTLDARHPSRIDIDVAAAMLARRGGDFEQSLQRLHTALQRAEQVIGIGSETIARIENELGASYNGLGRFDAALEHLARARAAYGNLEEPVADIDANIGAIHENLEDYPRAIDYARRALAVQMRDPEGNRLAIRQVRSNLGQALSLNGEHAEALALTRAAVADSVQASGEGSAEHVLDRFRLAAALRRAGEAEAAKHELDALTPTMRALLGDDGHPFQFYRILLAARIERDRGDVDAGRAGLVEALAFAATHPGADPVAVALASSELAALLPEAELEQARALVRSARAALAEVLPEGAISRVETEALARRLGIGVDASGARALR